MLYLTSSIETRAEIITSHPDVAGFIFLDEGHLTKAYFPKRIRSWNASSPKHSIAAVTGNPSSHTPFTVPEKTLLGDNPYLVEAPKLHSSVPTISVGKFLKENKKDLQDLIPVYTDAKQKTVHMVSFPAVLPFLVTQSFSEGGITDNEVTTEFADSHELFQDWLKLKQTEFAIEDDFFEDVPNFPIPDDSLPFVYDHNLPLSVLRHRNGSPNATLTLLKEEVRRFVETHAPPPEPKQATPIPDNVSLAERSIVSHTSSIDSKMVEKNDKLISFLSILYSTPTYDRTGNVGSLSPAQLTDEALELLKNSSSTPD